MTPRRSPVRMVDLTPHPRDAWQAEHDRHEERFMRGLLYAVCLGILAWLGVGALVARC